MRLDGVSAPCVRSVQAKATEMAKLIRVFYVIAALSPMPPPFTSQVLVGKNQFRRLHIWKGMLLLELHLSGTKS